MDPWGVMPPWCMQPSMYWPPSAAAAAASGFEVPADFDEQASTPLPDVDIGAELRRIAAEAFVSAERISREGGIVSTFLENARQSFRTIRDYPDVMYQPGDILESSAAHALLDVDQLLDVVTTKRPGTGLPVPPTISDGALQDLKQLQRRGQDLAVLTCSRFIEQTALHQKGIPSELLTRLEAAFTESTLQDDALWSRLGNSKYHVFTQGHRWGERKHRHGRGGRKGRRGQRSADEDGGSNQDPDEHPATSLEIDSVVEPSAPPGLPPPNFAKAGKMAVGGSMGSSVDLLVGPPVESGQSSGSGGAEEGSSWGPFSSVLLLRPHAANEPVRVSDVIIKPPADAEALSIQVPVVATANFDTERTDGSCGKSWWQKLMDRFYGRDWANDETVEVVLQELCGKVSEVKEESLAHLWVGLCKNSLRNSDPLLAHLIARKASEVAKEHASEQDVVRHCCVGIGGLAEAHPPSASEAAPLLLTIMGHSANVRNFNIQHLCINKLAKKVCWAWEVALGEPLGEAKVDEEVQRKTLEAVLRAESIFVGSGEEPLSEDARLARENDSDFRKFCENVLRVKVRLGPLREALLTTNVPECVAFCLKELFDTLDPYRGPLSENWYDYEVSVSSGESFHRNRQVLQQLARRAQPSASGLPAAAVADALAWARNSAEENYAELVVVYIGGR